MRLGLNINIGGLGGIGQPRQRQEAGEFKIHSSQKKSQTEEKIDFEELKEGIILELAHLLELENHGLEVTKKMKFLLNFIPEAVRKEVLRKAKEALNE